MVKISRRQVTAAMLLLVMVASPVVTACSSPAPTAAPAPPATPKSSAAPTAKPTAVPTPATTSKPTVASTTAPAPTPKPAPSPAARKPSGTLNLACDGLGTEIWLPYQASGNQLTLIGSVFDFPIGRDIKTNTLIPQVAEKWEQSKDGLSWRFYLRKGIQFHDNYGELTAQDVKFSIDMVSRTDSVSSGKGFFTQNVKDVQVVNPYELVINTKSICVNLPYNLSNVTPIVPIVSKKYVESVGEKVAQAHPVGSGPYKFVEQKAGTYVKLEAQDTHWRQTPYFKTVIQTVVPEIATRLAMLKAGGLDIASIGAPYKKEAQSMGVELRSQPNVQEVFIALGGQLLPSRPTYDATVPWVGDSEKATKVRKALNLAVNKQEIVDGIFKGEAQPLTLPVSFFGRPWLDPTWKPYPYDPEQARKLLAEAGYPNGFEATMRPVPYEGVPETVDVAEAVAMYWEKIGLKVKREPMEYNVDRGQVVARTVPPGRAWGRALSPKDEPSLSTVIHSTDSIAWMGEYTYVDDLLKKAEAELIFDKRVQLYRELGKFYYEGYHCIPLVLKNNVFGVSSKVGPLAQLPGWGHLVNIEYITQR